MSMFEETIPYGEEEAALRADQDRHAQGNGHGPKREWEPPAPLGEVGRNLPAFPIDVLPSWMSDFLAALATDTQTPRDLGGMLSLAALAAAASGRVMVEVRPGWLEPVNLFVVVALGPGNRKSAVHREIVAPIRAAERAQADEMAPQINEQRTRKHIAEGRAEKALAQAVKAKASERDDAQAEALQLAEEAAEIAVPVSPRMIADDVTAEALGSLLADYDGRMAVLSAEGGIFDIMAGRYSKAGAGLNLDVFLKGHAGDEIRVDRKGRPAERIERPALTIGLAVQPDVLRSIAGQREFWGRGLLARFLYALPESTVGRRQVGTPVVPDHLRDGYRAELKALCASLADLDELAVLPLDRDAAELLLAFQADLEPRLHPETGDLGHVTEWASKLAGAVARISGLLHLAEHLRDGWARPVGPATVMGALVIADYLIEHALAALGCMGTDDDPDSDLKSARYVLDWLRRHEVEAFTVRDLFSALPRGTFAKVDDLRPALEMLQEHGHIRPQPVKTAKGRPGRKPSPAVDVNPYTRPHNPHNPQNLVSAGQRP